MATKHRLRRPRSSWSRQAGSRRIATITPAIEQHFVLCPRSSVGRSCKILTCPSRVCFCRSPNHYRLAVATTDRYITLYDEDGVQRDKFPTKPADKALPTAKNYAIRGMEWSQDSEKLAVAQSDNIVFIYKVGKTWADKKTICNKYPQAHPVTCLTWPAGRPTEIVFGCADGKMRVGNSSNKTVTLYDQSSYIVACASSPDGQSFVSASADGKILRYTFPTSEGRQAITAEVARVNFVPYCIGWGNHIVVSGNVPQVKFFDISGGNALKTFDYSSNENIKEFSSCSFSPSGETVVLGNFNRFIIYAYNANKNVWEEAGQTVVENLYAVTALRWKSDGSRLVTGSLCGVVDIYDAALRRFNLKGDHEITYTSPSSLVLKKHSDPNVRLNFKSRYGSEIKKINLYQKRYLVVHTTDTLMVGDIISGKTSEVPWTYRPDNPASPVKGARGSQQQQKEQKEKFFFDSETSCMVFYAGELTIIEYGNNTPLEPLRTEYMSPHLISVRMNEPRNKNEAAVKKIAYLLDSQSIRVMDLARGTEEASINHDTKIDWLELNSRGSKLLFRDKKRCLHLYDIHSQQRHTLLNFCNYVQWVPDSDVVVAQSRRTLCVWYSIDNPKDVTNFVIKGDVEEIERTQGRTEVMIDEGITKTTIALDESLIAFGAAVDAHDFKKAVTILEALKEKQEKELGVGNMSAGAEAMWTQLSRLALEEGDFVIAERCFSALGDVSKTKYLHKINALLLQNGGDVRHYLIQAHINILNGKFKVAENILLNQGKVDEVVQMYRNAHQWEDALQVAVAKQWPHLKPLREQYFQYLIQTRQEEIAGEFKEKNQEYQDALQLYLRGGYPTKAANLVLQQGLTSDASLCERVATALIAAKAFEKAGEFLEALKQPKRALECYQRGHAYNKAVALCRREFPAQVVQLYEEWGDVSKRKAAKRSRREPSVIYFFSFVYVSLIFQYCVSQKQMDAASNHYIQASAGVKAINASIEAKQWKRAIEILDTIDPRDAKPYYRRIAQNCAENKRYPEAEKYFVQAGLPQEAVAMYTQAQLWDKAHSLAVTYMSPEEVKQLYVQQGLKLELAGKLKDAEKLYLTVGEADHAINMYRKARQYDDMVRLVSQHRSNLLNETHHSLAHQFETEGNFKSAEKHYLLAKMWQPVVKMYKDADMWEDVLRVAKQHGGMAAYKQWAYNFAMSVGGEAGTKLLVKRGLGELAVDYAVERGDFTQAFHIAEISCKHKQPDIHLQHAMHLEDEGKFELAESEFIKAKKPKEAIDMYLHQQQWENALRVAEQYDPPMVPDVYEANAKHIVETDAERTQTAMAEQLFLSAKKPEAAINMYRNYGRFDDALRIARKDVPRMVAELQREKDLAEAAKYERPGAGHAAPGGGSSEAGLMGNSIEALRARAKTKENDRQWAGAIDTYLEINETATSDVNQLEKAWERAVTIAMEHLPARIGEVVNTVAKRLIKVKRYDQAAELYTSIDDFKQAIDAYIAGKLWAKAKDLARTDAPEHMTRILNAEQGENKEHVLEDWKEEDKIKQYIDRNEWQKVYELVTPHGEETLAKYASMHAALLVNENKFKEALGILVKYGLNVIPANFPVFKRVAQRILCKVPSDAERSQSRHPELEWYNQLREMLFKLVSELETLDPQGKETQEFAKYLFVTHLCSLKFTCDEKELKGLSAKIATSLLRYTMDVPVDKAFYDAGQACREQGQLNMAFVFLNRFVDLTDAMADPDAGDIDNTDFMETDIPNPIKVPIPEAQYYPQDLKDEAKEWVLEKAMSNEVNPELPTRNCEKCGKSTYDAGVECHSCHHTSTPCIVTGYPVTKKEKVKCKSCQKDANKTDWNK
jgi:intraflagellar transport protein 172